MNIKNRHIFYPLITLIVIILLTGDYNLGSKIIPGNSAKMNHLYSQSTGLHSTVTSIDQNSGIIRYVYSRIPGTWPGTPENAANNFLKKHGINFGIHDPENMLTMQKVLTTPAGNHIVYSQKWNGLPVYRSEIVITLTAGNEVAFIASSLKKTPPAINIISNISANEAQQKARQHIGIIGRDYIAPATKLVLFVSETNKTRLAFQVRIANDNPRGDWELLVDARNGEILKTKNRIMYQTSATGRGAVFNPDPLSSAGIYYGGSFSDPGGADLDNDSLNAQRVIVDLKDISEQDSMYYLSGPYAELRDVEPPDDVFPVLANPDSFIYQRSQQEFEAVMVYYHIDKSYRYLMSLGFDIPGLYSFNADPHGAFGEDNSYYIGGGANFCVFGEGGVDDAEDAAVIWHEYAHAIQDNIVQPFGMIYAGETKSLQEGSSDYWATSYKRSQTEFAWQHVFMWDAGIAGDNGGVFWGGRRSDTDLKYPDDYDFSPDREHYNGQIWSSALMHIQSEIGRTVTDRLFIQTHYLWGTRPGFEDAARAFIQSDSLLYNGVHTPVLARWFTYHGLIKLNDYLPEISLEPLPDTEDVAGPYFLSLEIIPGKAALDTANMWLVYWYDQQPADSVQIETDSTANLYYSNIPGSGTTGDVNFYISVKDSINGIAFDPLLAPLTYYSFYAGPDSLPPVVNFSPLQDQPIVRWPAELVVHALDNIGIAEIRVDFYLNIPSRSDSFLLESRANNIFTGTFPVNPDSVSANDSVFYKIEISDNSQTKNTVLLPDTGFFAFKLVSGGGIVQFSFEFDTAGSLASGDWQWGSPANGPGAAYEGTKLWATELNQVYAQGPALSDLILPEIDLNGFNHAKLKFWHWYDIERKFDGGNIKITSDSQSDWRLLVPLEGYDVIIDTSFGNPLAGERAFSGNSAGWICSIFSLDEYTGEKIRLKFDFGSDLTETGLGWYIDLVSIADEQATIAAPSNLEVTDNRDKITLHWDAQTKSKIPDHRDSRKKAKATETGGQQNQMDGGLPVFYIYRSLSGTDFSVYDSTISVTYSDSLVKPGFTYYYFVTFSNGELESMPSDTVEAVVEPITSLDENGRLPETFAIFQNYPNPFNPVTIIRYQLPTTAYVEILVYNLLGEKINTLVAEEQTPGRYRITWHGQDEWGNRLASGLYFYQIRAGEFFKTMKMILIK